MLLPTLISLLLSTAVVAAPSRRVTSTDAAITEAIPPARLAVREAEAVGLVPRALQVCTIIGSSSSVNCRYHATTGSSIITTFAKGTGHDFTCYAVGECINGNCTWDYAVNWDCFVSGYYTSSNCNTSNLPVCGFS
ncbi:hypothetical protein BKA64DRAFT_680065 [Cadophora sp. MPI-SDFR-AT-0126]|nr:hypothetical protein BKA64DRAFT_680065 [Leotiomycetes sp. MPI-SDFR-AT-0126]